MNIIRCPKCSSAVPINIVNAKDEHGEVFECPRCKFLFRYAPNG